MNIISIRNAGFALGLIILLVAMIAGTGLNQDSARAQGALSVASIAGTYTAYSTAETRTTINGSVLSVAEFDGAGSWTSSILRNTAVSDSERAIEILSSFGTYEVQDNGIGFAEAQTDPNDGVSNDADFDFVVTHTETTADGIVATGFYALPRLSSTGFPAGVTFRRLPDGITLNNSSLEGIFSVSYFVGENESAGLGSFSFNGLGSVTGTLLSNESGEAQTAANANYLSCLFPCLIGQGEEVERLVTTSEVDGTYQLQADATGIFDLSVGGESTSNYNILVTGADETGRVTELIALQQEPQGNGSALRSLVLTRLY